MQYRFRRSHKSTRNFRNTMAMVMFQLSTPTTCAHCHAQLFYHESRDMCCSGGKFILPHVTALDELIQIFFGSSSESRHFRQHIRSYNHVLSFTSLGVHMD